MSRSRRKPKVGICVGSNTEYYRERNRNTRTKNKRILRKALMDGKEDEINFIPNNKNPSYDTYCEPTDGSYMIPKNDDFFDYERFCRK